MVPWTEITSEISFSPLDLSHFKNKTGMVLVDITEIFISLFFSKVNTELSELILIWTRSSIEQANHEDLKTISETIRSLDKLYKWLIVLLNAYTLLLTWTHLHFSSSHWT